MQEMFDSVSEYEYLAFHKVPHKLSKRADLHAFILLDLIVPSVKDIVGGAGHDIIYLDVDAEEFEKNATMDNVINLVRCGVMCNEEENEGLFMFV